MSRAISNYEQPTVYHVDTLKSCSVATSELDLKLTENVSKKDESDRRKEITSPARDAA